MNDVKLHDTMNYLKRTYH